MKPRIIALIRLAFASKDNLLPIALLLTLSLNGCKNLPSSSTWRPSWETIPDKNKKAKQQLSSTLTFADDWLGFVPILNDDEQKRLHQQDIQQKELFVQAFRSLPECKGITFMRTSPKNADFDVQVFNGLDGRTGRWQWVLYRTDIGERLGYGDEDDVGGAAKSVCGALHANVQSVGGKVE